MRSRQFFNIYCDLLYLEWKFDQLNIKLARVNMKSDVFNRLLCFKRKKRLLNALKRFKAFKTLLHFKKRFKWNPSWVPLIRIYSGSRSGHLRWLEAWPFIFLEKVVEPCGLGRESDTATSNGPRILEVAHRCRVAQRLASSLFRLLRRPRGLLIFRTHLGLRSQTECWAR